MTPHKVLLLILDGFGIRETLEHNAIASANAPTWQKLWAEEPHTLLEASGVAVGLPAGQMGNSEVGHLTIGAGRTLYQDLTRIDHAIETHALDNNTVLQQGLSLARDNNRAVHFLGLLSPGGVHSHELHLFELLKQCKQQNITKVYIHAFLDGRDVPPQSAAASLERLETVCKNLQCGQIASLCGRYYAMDRDQRWDRVIQAYKLLTENDAPHHADNALNGLTQAYQRGETDEFVVPTLIGAPHPIQDGDVVIFWNYRSDRARELSRAFLQADFTGFKRNKTLKLGAFISMTHYADDIASQILFAPQSLSNTLGAYVDSFGIPQLRIAETEKYAHVTFFFNGGVETHLPLEQRCLIASPKVSTYDLQPAMSAPEISAQLIEALDTQEFGLIVCNFANPDMLGHTGNFAATQQSIEILDHCLQQVLAAAQANAYEVIITADHGNAECMYDEVHHQPHTAHTTDPVPFVYIGRSVHAMQAQGTLADIAPTILYLMGLPIPVEMTGQVLINLKETHDQ